MRTALEWRDQWLCFAISFHWFILKAFANRSHGGLLKGRTSPPTGATSSTAISLGMGGRNGARNKWNQFEKKLSVSGRIWGKSVRTQPQSPGDLGGLLVQPHLRLPLRTGGGQPASCGRSAVMKACTVTTLAAFWIWTVLIVRKFFLLWCQNRPPLELLPLGLVLGYRPNELPFLMTFLHICRISYVSFTSLTLFSIFFFVLKYS